MACVFFLLDEIESVEDAEIKLKKWK